MHKNIVKVAEIVEYFILIDYSGNGLLFIRQWKGLHLNVKRYQIHYVKHTRLGRFCCSLLERRLTADQQTPLSFEVYMTHRLTGHSGNGYIHVFKRTHDLG